MGNGFIMFTEKDWEKAQPEQRDWFIFNTLQSMDKRLKKLEQWFSLKAAFIFAGSAVGGALMILILITLKIRVF